MKHSHEREAKNDKNKREAKMTQKKWKERLGGLSCSHVSSKFPFKYYSKQWIFNVKKNDKQNYIYLYI